MAMDPTPVPMCVHTNSELKKDFHPNSNAKVDKLGKSALIHGSLHPSASCKPQPPCGKTQPPRGKSKTQPPCDKTQPATAMPPMRQAATAAVRRARQDTQPPCRPCGKPQPPPCGERGKTQPPCGKSKDTTALRQTTTAMPPTRRARQDTTALRQATTALQRATSHNRSGRWSRSWGWISRSPSLPPHSSL
jgi:hypothetical protein